MGTTHSSTSSSPALSTRELPGGVHATPQPRTEQGLSTPSSSRQQKEPSASAAGGHILLLSDERSASLLAQLTHERSCGDVGATLDGHGRHCTLVLVKTCGSLHANYEQTAKLKFELAIHSKLQAATDADDKGTRKGQGSMEGEGKGRGHTAGDDRAAREGRSISNAQHRESRHFCSRHLTAE